MHAQLLVGKRHLLHQCMPLRALLQPKSRPQLHHLIRHAAHATPRMHAFISGCVTARCVRPAVRRLLAAQRQPAVRHQQRGGPGLPAARVQRVTQLQRLHGPLRGGAVRHLPAAGARAQGRQRPPHAWLHVRTMPCYVRKRVSIGLGWSVSYLQSQNSNLRG